MSRSIKRMQAKRAAGNGGFTLIELLVVIIVLGILAAVVVFSIQGVDDRGEDAAAAIDARTLRAAQEAYQAQNNAFGDENDLVREGFLNEGSTLHDVVVSGDAYFITCDPNEPTCGQNGTTPDGNFPGAEGATPTGMWSRTGDLPAGSTQGTGLITMSNGKVFSWGTKGISTPTQVSGNPYAPGPMAVYDPASDTWAAVQKPPSPAGSPPNLDPAWNALGGSTLVNIEGTSAECGTNCGKVFIQAGVSTNVAPYYFDAVYYMFDPAAFDAGSSPWIVVPDPLIAGAGFHTGGGAKVLQLDCSRSANPGSDCGKLMLAYGINDRGWQATPGRDADTPKYQVKFWDPAGGPVGTWSLTSSPDRRVCNTGPEPATWFTGSGQGVSRALANATTPAEVTAAYTVTCPTGGFLQSDVGSQISGTTLTPAGQSSFSSGLGPATLITAVSPDGTVATLNRPGAPSTGTDASLQSNRIFIVGSGIGGGLAAQPGGRALSWTGFTSRVYDPFTHTWSPTATPAANLVPITRTVTNGVTTSGSKVISTPTAGWTEQGADLGADVSGPGIPVGAKVASVSGNNATLTLAATATGSGLSLTISNVALGGQMPGYTCSATPTLVRTVSTAGQAILELPEGKVLQLRPMTGCSGTGNVILPKNTLLFDPGTNLWGFAPSDCPCPVIPGVIRLGPTAGNRLFMIYAANQSTVSYGSTLGAADASAWTPVTSTFTARSLNIDGTPRPSGGSATAGLTVLNTGQVLLAGGTQCVSSFCSTANGSAVTKTDTWLYTPAIG